MRGQYKTNDDGEGNNASPTAQLSEKKQISEYKRFTFAVADFSLMDKSMNQWIPKICPDADQNRLIEFLSFTALVDPKLVRLSMCRLLGQENNKL
jgi:hypothetical protein